MTVSKTILTHLNKAQQAAVSTAEGPKLVLAGAGSGKTRVLTYRIAYLISEKGVDPANILAVTFTNKAAGEMRSRVNKLVKDLNLDAEDSTICTFHSLCARILRREGQHLGLSLSFLIYDETDQLSLMKKVMENLGIPKTKFNPRSILSAISAAKNELIGSKTYQTYARGYFTETVARLYPAYQQALREAQAVDFDDLLTLIVKLFQENPEVLEKYQNKFQYVLIDEYQDTNRAQYVLTKQLAQKHQNLFVVGDASQSIYSFRGADFRNLTSFQNDFPQIEVFNLERNYRSTQIILETANAVISHNTSHPVLKLYTQNRTGDPIRLYQALDEHDEARFITETVQEIACQDLKTLNDSAVLYRTNAQSRIFEESFLRAGIPYVLVGGTKFYERKEIKDVLAYLRLVYNSEDRVSWERVLKLGKGRYHQFEDWLTNLPSIYTTTELLDQVLKVTGYLDLYDPKREDDHSRLENIKELRSVAAEFPNLGQFLENVALVQQESLPDKPTTIKSSGVTLLTVHAAKGLEFSTVFMVGMEENLFPHARSILDKMELEEERRLAYVGMTRAKNNLLLTYTRRRLYLGTINYNQPSRFVEAIPETLLERTGISQEEGPDILNNETIYS
jgi:DNA helicase-2/ATP-dependent DNA helicase PcrA